MDVKGNHHLMSIYCGNNPSYPLRLGQTGGECSMFSVEWGTTSKLGHLGSTVSLLS